jgi:hypothetical protein
MTFQGGAIREQGVTFALVIAKKHVIDSPTEASRDIADFSRSFRAC